jgi:hypothetical protein
LMGENTAKLSRDFDLLWVSIQEATQEERPAELAEIAISLYGQLGEARAEITRLRAALRSYLCAISMTGPGGFP